MRRTYWEGYRLDPENYEALKETVCTTNASELWKFVHAVWWMATEIPALEEQVAPLRELLEAAYEKVGSRKKTFVKMVRHSDIGWDDNCKISFEQVRESLCNGVKLSHRDPEKTVRVHTDVRDML